MSAPPPPEPPKKDDAPPPPAAPPAPPPATAKAPSEASTKKKGKSAVSLPPPSASPSGAAIGLRQVEVKVSATFVRRCRNGSMVRISCSERLRRVPGLNIFCAICGFLFLWLLAAPGAGLICNLIGIIYPAYASVVALRSAGKEDDTQWLVYWTTYGTFSLVDQFADRITPYFPLYWPLKALFLLYLYLPQTYGAQNMYVKYLDPAFDKLAKRVAGI
uniref:Receptor expression-enhancing protein n=1 Tax=Meloidogyne enterolobii TaxID=390850 RepID=A0A6V7UQL4_MELEN|nr:unnamed protein product [Meloidogyne enterolobii]